MAETQRIVRTIPATFAKTTSMFTKMVNVGAYARVSTKTEEQEDSYERQVNHYSNYIKHHEGWNFVDIYADEGIKIYNSISDKYDIASTRRYERFPPFTVGTTR